MAHVSQPLSSAAPLGAPRLAFEGLVAEGLSPRVSSQQFMLRLRRALADERCAPELLFDVRNFSTFVSEEPDVTGFGDRFLLEHGNLASELPVEIGAQYCSLLTTAKAGAHPDFAAALQARADQVSYYDSTTTLLPDSASPTGRRFVRVARADHPRLHAVLPNVPLGRTTAVETAASILNPPRPTRSSDDAAVQRPPEFVPSLSGADQALLADLLARIDALRLAFPGLACRAAGVRDLAELSSVRVQAPFRWVSAAAVHSLATYQRQQQALQELMVAMANNLQASGGDVSGAVLSAATHPQFDDAESAGLICRLFGLLPVGSLAVRAVLRALPRATATDFDREHLAAIESWSAVVDHRVVLHRLLDKLDSLQHDRLLLDVGEAPPRAVVGAMCHWFRELRGVQDEDRRLCVSCLRELQLAKQRAGDLGAGDLAVLVDTLRRYADAAAVAAQAMEGLK
ncbi:MAG: hypothetical protein AAFQ81_19370 [Pseudomonadota bacterium]